MLLSKGCHVTWCRKLVWASENLIGFVGGKLTGEVLEAEFKD